MPGMTVLDPRGEETAERVRLAPRLDNLKGKKLAVVIDGPWRSWYTFVDRMEEIIRDSGEECTFERIEILGSHISRTGLTPSQHELDREDKELRLREFAGTVDAVVVGLGN